MAVRKTEHAHRPGSLAGEIEDEKMNEEIKRLESELSRLGVSTTRNRPEGLSVYADASLPRGWVRVDSNGDAPVFGLPETFADNLKMLSPERVGEDCGGVWDVLSRVGFDKVPATSQEWPEDLIQCEQLETGDCNDNPNTLITIETNGGTRYAAGPHGENYCALSDWLTNVGELAATREEAVRVGCAD